MLKKIVPPPLSKMVSSSTTQIKENIEIISDKENLISIRVKEPFEEFYFLIHNLRNNNNNVVIEFSYCPTRIDIVQGVKTAGTYDGLENCLKLWSNLVKEYAHSENIFEDPLTKHYEEQFAQFIYIDEDDADTKPFSADKILLLGELIEKVNSIVEKSEDTNEEDKQMVITQGRTLKNKLLSLSKNEALKQFRNFTSNAVKMSFDILKDVIVDVLADIAKKMIGLP